MASVASADERIQSNSPDPEFDWRRVAWCVQLSRAMDALEEGTLVQERKILYQFSARGHDLALVLLGS